MERKLHFTQDEHMFVSNIPLFVRKRERILASPQMAGVVVPVNNGLAYSGPFKPRTLGSYLQWWYNNPELSHDKWKRPIWKIAGSQLSGCHACLCVDDKGVSHPAELNADLITVTRSFLDTEQFPHRETSLSQLIEILNNG
ncbi:MAG: hypothetical protein NC217_04555 [Muribaculaceae bacterium]|nr:hypothetical protein [Muribaculaceae bacterium]